MEESGHEWDVVVNGTKQIFYCLVGDCSGTLTRSKLCGLNHHRAKIHNLPPIPQRPRGRERDINAKRNVKSPNKILRQNQKIKYDVDVRLCRAHRQAYKRFVNEEIISASLAKEDDLNDASKQRIHEKMQRWDQSLPRRRMDTTNRIQIALQRKGGGIGETTSNNEYTPNQQDFVERSPQSLVASSSGSQIQPTSSFEPLRRSPRFQGVLGEVLLLEPLESCRTPEHGQNLETNVNEMDQDKECKSPQSLLHTNDGEHVTPLLEIHQKSPSLQPLRRSPRFQRNLGSKTKKVNDAKRTKITPKDLKARGFKSRKQYIEHVCSTSIAVTKPTRFVTLNSKTMRHG